MSWMAGLAIMFCALAWALGASIPSVSIGIRQLGMLVFFAACAGIGGGLFWSIGEQWVNAVKEKSLSGRHDVTAANGDQTMGALGGVVLMPKQARAPVQTQVPLQMLLLRR